MPHRTDASGMTTNSAVAGRAVAGRGGADRGSRSVPRLRIVCLGYIVRGPMGGMAWHHLNYLLGLIQLGHEVLFLEDSTDWPACFDPQRLTTDADPSFGLRFATETFNRLGLPEQWAYFDAHTDRWLGPAAGHATRFIRDADVVLNISAVNPLRGPMADVPRRVLIDTDPGFTQIRHLTEDEPRAIADAHNVFFTFGENVGRPGCTLPDDGRPWQPTRQPVPLHVWPRTDPPTADDAAFTTVMQWDSYRERTWAGVTYGMKSRSFEPYFDLPRHTDAPLELAINCRPEIRQQLAAGGWRVAPAFEIARDPWTYRRYLEQSFGECTVAKHGYVISRSGWFSERTACYLALGRPAVVQDTGLADHLPVGEGLLTFDDPAGAVAALDQVRRDPARHRRAARAIAERHFDATGVLTSLLERTLDTARR